MNVTAQKIAFAGAIAGGYAALTLALAPISYGAVQFRVSEALCVLPFFIPCSAWGLFIGCAIANLISAAGLPDIVFGSSATLAASLCVAATGKRAKKKGIFDKSAGMLRYRLSVCLLPAVFNGPVIGAVLAYTATPEAFLPGLALIGSQVAAGETAVMLVLGLPLMRYLPRLGFFSRISEKF